MAVGRDGALYAGGEAGQVYRISADGVDVRTLGNAGGFCLGITLDKEQNIYICDCGKRALLRMTQAGKVTTIAAINDICALGALRAVRQMERERFTAIVGYDLNPAEHVLTELRDVNSP